MSSHKTTVALRKHFIHLNVKSSRLLKCLLLVAISPPAIQRLAASDEVVQPVPKVQQQAVNYRDGRAIVMQRLDRSPVRPIAAATAPPAALEETPQPEVHAKPHHLLAMSCTVYDNKLSLVHWTSGGRSYSAFVNIDFNTLAGIGSFETQDAVFSLIMGIGNDTSERLNSINAELEAAGHPASSLMRLPADSAFPAGLTSYLPVGPTHDASHLETDCAGLEALLEYFDSNRQALEVARQQREAEQLQREQYLKTHPPAPKDTVIQFWPVRSQRYQVVPQEAAP